MGFMVLFVQGCSKIIGIIEQGKHRFASTKKLPLFAFLMSAAGVHACVGQVFTRTDAKNKNFKFCVFEFEIGNRWLHADACCIHFTGLPG